MTMSDRLALCNEVLAPWSFEAQCAYASRLGYRALEVAPYTLADDPGAITEAQAAGWRRTAETHGLAISGLHWLLVKPDGLCISSPDPAVRRRTVDFIRRLIDLCALLGGSYLVHGSPAQRNPAAGQSVVDAVARATECWVAAGEHAGKAGLARRASSTPWRRRCTSSRRPAWQA
jgi:sugar phosphate isomerase/epimerase